ncbi:MAG: winged helix-turn-helix domain-containing protein, partial [Deltaproteobacteria bacterium]|nr:winged helix-turn-helix domain-containing protein [Deltaproteobacteria bacterium]
MAGTRERGRAIRSFNLAHVGAHGNDIGQVCAAHYGISRQAVNKHLRRLVVHGLLTARGATRNRHYSLTVLTREKFWVQLTEGVNEDAVWRTKIGPLLSDLPQRTREI